MGIGLVDECYSLVRINKCLLCIIFIFFKMYLCYFGVCGAMRTFLNLEYAYFDEFNYNSISSYFSELNKMPKYQILVSAGCNK